MGQIHGVLAERAPACRVIDLMHDAPRFAPAAAAHLLASLVPGFPPGSVFVCVVDPGVGTERATLVVSADGRWLVGPDNGLLEVTAARARRWRAWSVRWRPRRLSRTFHGRDLFAPVAARIGREGRAPESWLEPTEWSPGSVPDLAEVVYVDAYGNAMTGLRSVSVSPQAVLECRGGQFRRGGTFGEVPIGEPLWYENSNHLVELALNRGSAASAFGLGVGDPVRVRGAP